MRTNSSKFRHIASINDYYSAWKNPLEKNKSDKNELRISSSNGLRAGLSK